MKMPEDTSSQRIPGNQVSGRIACKQQASPGGQNARAIHALSGKIVTPSDLSRLIVDGLQDGLSPQRAPVTAIAFRFVLGIRQVRQAVASNSIDIEEPGFRIETRREPVCAAEGVNIQ